MPRTRLFHHLGQLLRVATIAERSGEGDTEAIERLRSEAPSRRRVLRATGAAALAGVLPAVAAPGARGADVAVVGAGFAGLHAATLLAAKGARPTLYEAGSRSGGRVWSLRGFFPGQVAERGAELIDTTHSTLRGLANAFGLTLESYAANQLPGEESFYFFGRHWSEAQVVAEFRAFVPAMKADLTRLSNGPTAFASNEADRALDRLSISEYLASRGAGALLKRVLEVAYTIEFGREADRQSALALLFFVATNRRQAFTPFGVFSDERFHIVEGNDAVASGLAAQLPAPVQHGQRLLRVACLADGRPKLAFATAGGVRETVHDAVVLTLPAPAMREIEFDASCALPASKRLAIAGLDYGTSTKQMIGFTGRPWYELHASSGASYSDLVNHQSTWETNPSRAIPAERGVLTDFCGGERGARLDPSRAQREAEAFLADLDRVWPGSAARARRDARGRVQVHLENWSRLAGFGGGYTNNPPGYFTTIEGLYALPVGRLFFAGEHTDSFYGYQGFMEGALLSGARAADEVLRAR